jgi:predicted PurR-regulated permease PerM
VTIHGAFRIGLLGGLGVLTALLIGGAFVTLASVITYVGFALFLALGLDPIVQFLESKNVPRWLAIVIVISGVIGIVVGFILAVIPVVVEQTTTLYNAVLEFLTSYDSLGDLVAAVQQVVPIETLNVQSAVDSLIAFMSDPANLANIGGGVLSVGFTFANAALGVFLTTMLTIYLVVSLPRIKSSVYSLVPATRREKFHDLSEQVTRAVGQYVIGQGSQGLTNGILSFIVLSILGAHYPALFALIALMFSLIPLVGTITGSIIIVVTQLLVDPTNPYLALWMAIYYLVYLQIEAYVIGPMIMNRAVQVPGVVVIVAALAGGSLMGVLGAIVAIPLAASVLIIVREVIVPAQNAR